MQIKSFAVVFPVCRLPDNGIKFYVLNLHFTERHFDEPLEHSCAAQFLKDESQEIINIIIQIIKTYSLLQVNMCAKRILLLDRILCRQHAFFSLSHNTLPSVFIDICNYLHLAG